MPLAPLRALLSRFRRQERGSITAETVIVLPLLVWAATAMVAYWDVYRSINRVQSATYAMLDVVSRQNTINPTTYVPMLDNVIEYFIDSDQQARVRLTVICFNPAANQFRVVWSRSADNALPQLTTATLQTYRDMIPIMAGTDRAIVIETEVDYVPTINLGINEWIGVGPQLIREFAVQRPRSSSGRLQLTTLVDPGTCN